MFFNSISAQKPQRAHAPNSSKGCQPHCFSGEINKKGMWVFSVSQRSASERCLLNSQGFSSHVPISYSQLLCLYSTVGAGTPDVSSQTNEEDLEFWAPPMARVQGLKSRLLSESITGPAQVTTWHWTLLSLPEVPLWLALSALLGLVPQGTCF